MEKRTITRWWIGGLVLVATGAVVCATGVGLILAFGGTFTGDSSGYEFVPRADAFFWTLVGICVLGCQTALAGLIVQLVAWIGALVNTSKLASKVWFVILLGSGLLGFTWVLAPLAVGAMVAYVVAGPDGTVDQQQASTLATQAGRQPTTLAPTS